MRWNKLGLLAGGLFIVVGGQVVAAEPLTAEQFADLHVLIKPAKTEDRWSRIPWQTSLWEGRRLAAAQGKPILLWEMDGHPLGCT
jgi:hypothetical protein